MRPADRRVLTRCKNGQLACLWKACEVQGLHLPTSAAELVSDAGRSGLHVSKLIVNGHKGQSIKRGSEGFSGPAPAAHRCPEQAASDVKGIVQPSMWAMCDSLLR